MTTDFFKALGAVFLVTGTCIGAGMLAMPMVTAQCGFGWSLLIFSGCWAVMLTSNLLVLEVNSALPEKSSFSSMALATLGKYGQRLTWVMFLLLLYALLAAYDTSGSSLLAAIFTQLGMTPNLTLCTLLFTVVLGLAVFLGTHITDYCNRLLLSIKLGFFLIAAFIIAPHIHPEHLRSTLAQARYIFAPIPVILVAFGSHFVIPSIRTYIGPDPKQLRRIIIIGMSIPFVIYLLWQTMVFGVLPPQGHFSLQWVHQHHDSAAALLLSLVHFLHGTAVRTLINAFVDIAVTTSFLGIALSLFDFFIDGLTLSSTNTTHRFYAIILTLSVPLAFALYYPNGFIMALQYGGVFAAVLVLILPALMSLNLQKKQLTPFYSLFGGRTLRFIILLAGISIIMLVAVEKF